jgi:hypothetical protein
LAIQVNGFLKTGTLPAEQAAVKYVEIAQSVAYEASSKESAKEFLVELFGCV